MASTVYYIEKKRGDSLDTISIKLDRLIEKSNVLNFIRKDDFTALKLHFGEDGNTGYIRNKFVNVVADKVSEVTNNAFLTDTNVLYKNSKRTNAVDHIKLAHSHGFGLEAMNLPVLIADGLWGRNYKEIKIGKRRFANVKIASDIADCDSLIALTHFTGHFMTGIGGAIKNLGMGCASRRGKYEQHSDVVPSINPEFCIGCGLCQTNCPSSCIKIINDKANIDVASCIGCGECVLVCRTKAIDIKWSEKLENLHEKMVEYAYGAVKAVDWRLGCISFLLKITKDCDCIAKNEDAIIEDLGILASNDPVSIDKASVDLINNRGTKDIFGEANPKTEWVKQLEYAEKIGLGSMKYKLVTI